MTPAPRGNQGLLLTGSGTSWTATETPLPAADPGGNVQPSSVASAPTTVRAVAGAYTDSSGNRQGVPLPGPG